MFKGSFKEISRAIKMMLKAYFNEEFPMGFKKVSRGYQEGFRYVSRFFRQNILGVSRVFQRCFKENSCLFSGSFKLALFLILCC